MKTEEVYNREEMSTVIEHKAVIEAASQTLPVKQIS
jgi:hypothetical protein